MGVLLNGSSWIMSSVNYTRVSSNHTVMFWARLDNSIAICRPFGNTGNWESRTAAGSGVLTSDYLQSGTADTMTLTVGTYHHIAFVLDVTGTTRYPYLDGVLQTPISSASFVTDQTDLMSIGVTPGGAGQGWNGAIDDIRVYDRVLSAAEIATIHACRGTDGILDSLEHWYPMNEGSEGAAVTSIYDHFGGINCATVTGTPTYNYDAGIKRRRIT